MRYETGNETSYSNVMPRERQWKMKQTSSAASIHSSVVDRWSLVDSCDRASDDTDDDDDDDDDFEGLSEPVHFSGHSSSLRRCVVASLRRCVVASFVVRRSSLRRSLSVAGLQCMGWVGLGTGEERLDRHIVTAIHCQNCVRVCSEMAAGG